MLPFFEEDTRFAAKSMLRCPLCRFPRAFWIRQGLRLSTPFEELTVIIRLQGPNCVSTIRISTATTNQNENAATKRTVVSLNSATAKQQLTTNMTNSNINKLRLKFKHAVFCSPVPTDSVNVNDRVFAGTAR